MTDRDSAVPASRLVFAVAVPPTAISVRLGGLALSLGLFALALLVRLPYLLSVPAYTDEGLEVLWALDIARGHHLPLTAIDAYYGPLHSYLLAGLFALFGPSLLIPRLTAAVAGATLVVVVYWLARDLWNRQAALVAAALTLLAPPLVVEASHNGWSNSLTPLLVALTMLSLYRGVTRPQPALVALSGLLAALTIQSHPISAVAVVGMVLWFLLRRDVGCWLRSPAPYAAVGLFLLGYAPMLIANRDINVLMDEVVGSHAYAFDPVTRLGEYVSRVVASILVVGRGVWDGWLPMSPGLRVLQAAALALVAAGLALAARRESRLLSLVFAMSILLQPLIVRVAMNRYLAYLMPLAAIAVGIAVATLVAWLGRRVGPRWARTAWLLPAVLALGAMWTLTTHYGNALTRGDSNLEFYRVRDEALGRGACGPGLVLEQAPVLVATNREITQRGFALGSLSYVLTMSGCGHTVVAPEALAARLTAEPDVGWLFAAEPPSATLPPTVRVETVTSMILPHGVDPNARLTLYRVTQATAAP